MRKVEATASLRGVTVILDDRPILRDVSVELGAGLTLVRGPNGAGKTTLLRAFAGLVPLARGTREMSGDALYIGHRPMLLRGLTARENLSFYMRFRGLAEDGVARALDAWGLGDDLDRPVERLSAGERRRASLARLDTEHVPVLLLDEPFADLDDPGVTRLRDAIARARDAGQTVIVATHAHHELDDRAASLIAMDGGTAAAV
jgi:heme ABC exporter ATP-binding subunit CcmA